MNDTDLLTYSAQAEAEPLPAAEEEPPAEAALSPHQQRMEDYARKQCRLSRIAAVCCAGLLAVVLICAAVLVPKANRLLTEADQALINLSAVTSEIAALDLEGTMAEVDKLVITAQGNLTAATSQLISLDTETLNKAIRDLAEVVEPLAQLFGR